RTGVDAAAARDLAGVADGSPGRALTLGSALSGLRREPVAQMLAGSGSARYVALMQLARDLNDPETDVAAKLELLLSHYRDAAVRVVHEGADPGALRRILQQADAVHEAWEAVRWSNPNRQLLLEALALRLART